MSKKKYLRILLALTFINLIWAFGYAIVGDFYPQLSTLQDVLEAKAMANGFLTVMGWALLPMAMTELKE